ncbi:hypothetical protein D3C71_2070710 [compost metagenome]
MLAAIIELMRLMTLATVFAVPVVALPAVVLSITSELPLTAPSEMLFVRLVAWSVCIVVVLLGVLPDLFSASSSAGARVISPTTLPCISAEK